MRRITKCSYNSDISNVNKSNSVFKVCVNTNFLNTEWVIFSRQLSKLDFNKQILLYCTCRRKKYIFFKRFDVKYGN